MKSTCETNSVALGAAMSPAAARAMSSDTLLQSQLCLLYFDGVVALWSL